MPENCGKMVTVRVSPQPVYQIEVSEWKRQHSCRMRDVEVMYASE